ncbi:MAG: hypothetical protein AB1478_02535 [Nitrospirota bacterium]
MLTNDNISGRNQANASFVPDVDGSYIIRLTVSDGDLTSNDDVVIISTTPNVPQMPTLELMLPLIYVKLLSLMAQQATTRTMGQ